MGRFYFFDCALFAVFLKAAITTTANTLITVPSAETLFFKWGFNFFVRIVVAFFALALTTSSTSENRAGTASAAAAFASTFVLFLFNWFFFFDLSFLKLQVEVEGI